MSRMKKQTFISRLADEAGISKKEANELYQAFVRAIVGSVLTGESVSLRGFGTFQLKKHKGHTVSLLGNMTNISDYYGLRFTASETLNKQIRQELHDENIVLKSSGDFTDNKDTDTDIADEDCAEEQSVQSAV